MVITLLTDFGLADEYAGVMEAVIAGIAPGVRVIHLTHGVPPHAVRAGALTLAGALPHCPVGVHVAVVDPGVGSERRAVVLETGDGRLLVGPDNGVLALAADATGGIVRAHRIDLAGPPASRTFHGRDVFAPVAARLASGLDLTAIGPVIDPGTIHRLPQPDERCRPGRIDTEVVLIDRFGNIALGVPSARLLESGFADGVSVAVSTPGTAYQATRTGTFGDVPPGEVVLFDDSAGRVALAANGASLAARTGAEPGQPVTLLLR